MAQKKPTVYEFIPKLGQLRDDVLFGDVWEHPDLSKRDRSLIIVAMLAALYRTDEMRGHMQRALGNGVTETEMSISASVAGLSTFTGPVMRRPGMQCPRLTWTSSRQRKAQVRLPG